MKVDKTVGYVRGTIFEKERVHRQSLWTGSDRCGKDSWNGDIVYVSIFEGWYIRGKQKRSLENEGGIFALNGLA